MTTVISSDFLNAKFKTPEECEDEHTIPFILQDKYDLDHRFYVPRKWK